MRALISWVISLSMVLGVGVAANAETTQNSPRDQSTPAGTPSNFDIDFVGYQEFSSNPNFHYFFIHFRGLVSAAQFNDNLRSWAAINIDADNDGKRDFRIDSTYSTLDADGASSEAEVFRFDASGEAIEMTECKPIFWAKPGQSRWVGFRLDYECLRLPQSFGMQGYADYIANDDFAFDFAPERTFFTVNHSFRSTPPSSSGNLERPALDQAMRGKVPNPSQPPLALEILSPKIVESVVQIRCARGLGSGWVAAVTLPAGLRDQGFRSFIVTNHHVVEDCLMSKSVELTFNDKSTRTGRVISWDRTNDLAGIVVDRDLPSLTWRGETPKQGWWVGVLGSPLGLSNYLTAGVVARLSPSTGELGITAQINPGNSGGPVFDRLGRVMGTVSWKFGSSEGLGFAKDAPLLCVQIITCTRSDVWTDSPSFTETDGEARIGISFGTLGTVTAGNQTTVTLTITANGVPVPNQSISLSIAGPAFLQANSIVTNASGLATVVVTTTTALSGTAVLTANTRGSVATTVLTIVPAPVIAVPTPTPSPPPSIEYKIIKRTLGGFPESSPVLTTSLRNSIKALVRAYAKAERFTCTGLIKVTNTTRERALIRSRAKSVCDYAESLNPLITTFFQTKIGATSSVGRVLIEIKTPAETW